MRGWMTSEGWVQFYLWTAEAGGLFLALNNISPLEGGMWAPGPRRSYWGNGVSPQGPVFFAEARSAA
jgi:hypothetical protein